VSKDDRQSISKRRIKFFTLEDSDSSAYWVKKKRNGYCLYGAEIGQIGEASSTILQAFNSDGMQYGSSPLVKIQTNVPLDELFEIISSLAFGPALHNASSFIINDAEIDVHSLRSVLIWHQQWRKNSTGTT